MLYYIYAIPFQEDDRVKEKPFLFEVIVMLLFFNLVSQSI